MRRTRRRTDDRLVSAARDAQIQTVTGPLAVGELGATLMHEHLTSLVAGRWTSGGTADDAVTIAERALACLSSVGVRSVVDLTPIDAGPGQRRDVTALREIAARTGLHVIASSAFYKEPLLPEWVRAAALDELEEFHTREATIGVGSTGVKVGVFGEVGTSLRQITPCEEKCLRAVARAHRATSLPISTHCTLGTMAVEQIAILQEEKVDCSRVVIGHLDLAAEGPYLEAVLAAGVTAGFDTFGKELFDYVVPNSPHLGEGVQVKWTFRRPDEARLDAIAWLVARGYEGQIVLSLDLTGHVTFQNRGGIGQFGYAYLHSRVIPGLLERGVGASTIERMLVDNPARLLCGLS